MPSRYVLGPEGARKLRELFAAKSAGGRRPGAGAAPVFDADFSAPFTVQWAASLATPESAEGAGDGTAGEWIIYLPASGILTVGSTAVNLTSALTAAGGDYPSGWYKLLAEDEQSGEDEPILDRDDGGTLYLNVTLGASPVAEFSATAGSGQSVIAIKICTVAVDSTTGARSVKQFASSVIVVGSGGGGGLPSVYDIVTDSSGTGGAERTHFTNCYFEVSGIMRAGPDLASNQSLTSLANKFVAIRLTSSGSATIATYNALGSMQQDMAGQTAMVIPLYELGSGGAIKADLRHLPRADAWSLTLT